MINVGRTGRKNKYETHVVNRLDEVRMWMENGATEKDIYETLGVSKESFYKYKRTYPDLFDALKHGKSVIVARTRKSMY